MLEQLEGQAQREVREEIKKRWEALGLTEGLSGELKETIRQLYESDAKPLNGDSEPTFPIIRKVWGIRKLEDDGISKEKE